MAWGPLGTVGQVHPEDYTDFVFSSGWLSALKARGGKSYVGTQTHNKVNTLAEELLDYNEDEANRNISPEVVDIEEIIQDLKSIHCTSTFTPYRASSAPRSSIAF